ncbi:hypothetical protein D8674_034744 [Pyrus ussuriensis x Pyrus communis]|uniref:Uncharacterized protein n=1 Tax=Pyrus ussuriensis x Pyrus communis TaxID=2448454 RepID=A0A5N5GAS8_9ROSA|nr:hypothetical protein D8674_034744 [Pyrus ussuriensis x Pyrus communis]
MSSLIRSRKAVTTAPRSIPLAHPSAVTTPAKMDHMLVDPVGPGSPRCRCHHPHQWCYLLVSGVVTAVPARPTRHQHPLLMPRGHNKAKPDEVRTKVCAQLSMNYNFDDINKDMLAYFNRLFAGRYKQWKSYLHQYFETFDPLVTLEEGCPKEFEDREDNWVWLCSHFQEPDYVKAKANKSNREKKTIFHHSGSKPFSYRMEARHRGVQIFRRLMSLATFIASSSSQSKSQVTALTAEVADLRTELASQSSIRLPDLRPTLTSKPLQPEHPIPNFVTFLPQYFQPPSIDDLVDYAALFS